MNIPERSELAPRQALNLILVLALTFGAGAVVLFGYFLGALYENASISPGSPISWLLIPAELREIEPRDQCAPLRHSRSLQECGGICGEFVGVNFGTTLSLEQLRAAYPLTPYLAATGYEEGLISLSENHPGDPANCPRAFIELYDDYSVSP